MVVREEENALLSNSKKLFDYRLLSLDSSHGFSLQWGGDRGGVEKNIHKKYFQILSITKNHKNSQKITKNHKKSRK